MFSDALHFLCRSSLPGLTADLQILGIKHFRGFLRTNGKVLGMEFHAPAGPKPGARNRFTF